MYENVIRIKCTHITTKTKTFIFQFSTSFSFFFLQSLWHSIHSPALTVFFFDFVLTSNINSCHFQWTKCILPCYNLCTHRIALDINSCENIRWFCETKCKRIEKNLSLFLLWKKNPFSRSEIYVPHIHLIISDYMRSAWIVLVFVSRIDANREWHLDEFSSLSSIRSYLFLISSKGPSMTVSVIQNAYHVKNNNLWKVQTPAKCFLPLIGDTNTYTTTTLFKTTIVKIATFDCEQTFKWNRIEMHTHPQIHSKNGE